MVLAWHVAQLTAYAPAKATEFVKLDALLDKGQVAAPKKSWKMQFSAVEAWVKSRRN